VIDFIPEQKQNYKNVAAGALPGAAATSAS
jgi:hypothetical protein